MKSRHSLLAVLLILARSIALHAEPTLANGTAANLSNRAFCSTASDVSISGFTIKDAASFVLIRAVGPSLSQFGVANPAPGTAFDVVDSRGVVVASGLPWNALSAAAREEGQREFQALGAFALLSTSADSYVYLCLNQGSYTVVARIAGSGPGVILTEVYFDSTGVGARSPTSFDSQTAAADFVQTLFAGGKQELVRVGQEDVLVVQIYGSGVPVLSVSAYRLAKGRWVLASERKPPTTEFLSFKASNGDVIAVGERTHGEWVLLDL